MSSDAVHILTLVGRSAVETVAAADALLDRHAHMHADAAFEERPDGLPTPYDAGCADIAAFCRDLLTYTRRLPVLYYSQFVNPYAVADHMLRVLNWPDRRQRRLHGLNFGCCWFPATSASAVLRQVQTKRRRSYRGTAVPERWYLDHVAAGFQSAAPWGQEYAVIVINETIGPTREDYEVDAAALLPLGATVGTPVVGAVPTA